MPVIILGLNAYHGDASACLVRDGRIIAAAEEERFRRIKHWAGFPSEAIRYCLREGGITLQHVEHVALNSDPSASLLRRARYAVLSHPDPRLVLDRLRNQQRRMSVERDFATAFAQSHFRGRVHRIEHHLAHLSSAFHVSPFKEAAVISVDGFGDFASAAWATGRGAALSIEGRVWFPHSLGVFYQALTQYLGFPHYGDEYKVMGLAPYGQPRLLDRMRQIVRPASDGSFTLDLRYFRHHREKIDYAWSGGAPHVGTLFSSALEELLGPARRPDEPLTGRHRDIARSVQAMYEEAFFNLLNVLHARHGLEAVAVAGGCGMNSVANGKIRRMTPFKRAYVQPAAGDAGGAIGAALSVWHAQGGIRVARMDHAYLGPEATADELAALVAARRNEMETAGCTVENIADEGRLCALTADAISDGRVIGWFQGRMEWGPRALGNRSILGDPRRADMKDILNLKIKRRESFRPFAPSIQREHVAQWFEEEDDVPFMMQVYQIREERRPQIPAVTHVDGSGRLQTVDRETNPRYWRLIEAFRAKTSVPMVLNTSFNENEPVVCRPQEALDCFLRTRMDVLVLGDWLVRRTATR